MDAADVMLQTIIWWSIQLLIQLYQVFWSEIKFLWRIFIILFLLLFLFCF